MKLMIASDIHGSALYCRQMLEAYRRKARTVCSFLGIFCTTVHAMTCRKNMPPKR